jgi:hypothetical protein
LVQRLYRTKQACGVRVSSINSAKGRGALQLFAVPVSRLANKEIPMRAKRSFLSVPVLFGLVAILMAASPPSASAITVTYTTTGSFSGASPNLDFTGIVPAATVNEPTGASFGTFEAFAGPLADYAGQTFTLNIVQSIPGLGAGSVVGTLTGKLQTSQSGLHLKFTDADIVTIVTGLTTVIYDPVNDTLIVPSTTNFGLTTLQGEITAIVPLPAAAWGGMALFGVLGGAKLRRSRQSVLA